LQLLSQTPSVIITVLLVIFHVNLASLAGPPQLRPSLVPLGQMLFLAPNPQCQSNKEAQSTDLNQWPGLFLSSSITRLLMEGAILPLHQLSHIYTMQ